MGFFSRLFGIETRAAGRTDYLPASVGIFGPGGFNDSGINVNETNAVTCSAVWACVQIISQAVAALPANVHRRDDATRLPTHPVAQVLDESPNPYMTPAVFRETLLANALLWGAGYSFIEKDAMGAPIGLYPLRSAVTRPFRTPGGELVYQTLVGTEPHFLTPDQVFYVPGLSLDGISALNVIANARQTIGTTLAMERFAAKFFGSGGNVGGILKLPKMSDDATKAFVASWKANYTGIENALRVAVLPDGYDFKPTSLEPEKSQMNQARQHQVLEIARFYRVPPHMLGIMDKASYASIEQTNLEFYQNTVQPWVVKIEQESNRKLLLEREKPTHEVKLNMDAMLRSSTEERYTAYQAGRQGGWLSINEIRRKENLPPVPGGDALLQPLNMTPVNGPAARAVIEETARRVLMKEGKALARAAKKFAGKPDDLKAWAETFYRSHAALVARTFAAPLKAAGLKTTPEQYAADHCAASRRAIDSGADAQDIADEWADIRPAEIADSLTEGRDNGNANA